MVTLLMAVGVDLADPAIALDKPAAMPILCGATENPDVSQNLVIFVVHDKQVPCKCLVSADWAEGVSSADECKL